MTKMYVYVVQYSYEIPHTRTYGCEIEIKINK